MITQWLGKFRQNTWTDLLLIIDIFCNAGFEASGGILLVHWCMRCSQGCDLICSSEWPGVTSQKHVFAVEWWKLWWLWNVRWHDMIPRGFRHSTLETERSSLRLGWSWVLNLSLHGWFWMNCQYESPGIQKHASISPDKHPHIIRWYCFCFCQRIRRGELTYPSYITAIAGSSADMVSFACTLLVQGIEKKYPENFTRMSNTTNINQPPFVKRVAFFQNILIFGNKNPYVRFSRPFQHISSNLRRRICSSNFWQECSTQLLRVCMMLGGSAGSCKRWQFVFWFLAQGPWYIPEIHWFLKSSQKMSFFFGDFVQV